PSKEILSALKAHEDILSACLYDKAGGLFATYPENLSADAFPAAPEEDGYRFAHSYLAAFQPVVQGSKRLGTLYLKSDMGTMYERVRLYGGIAVMVIVVSLSMACTHYKILQNQS